MNQAVYTPQVFQVGSIQDAKNIILTPEIGLTTNERWERETPYLTDLIARHIEIDANSRVLDFGGGIGRMCRSLHEKTGCHTTSLDISVTMRALSHVYVNNPKFFSIAHDAVSIFSGKIDVIIAIWVLQHVANVDDELACIEELLKPGGKLFVVNERGRCVPTTSGWVDDKIDIRIDLRRRFNVDVIDSLDPAIVTDAVSNRTFWGVFTK